LCPINFETVPRQTRLAQVGAELALPQRALENAGLHGQPGRELVSLAERQGVALIVTGTTDKNVTAEMGLGSVSEMQIVILRQQ
jgi:nucleotide-binding universal stress UspA family protein